VASVPNPSIADDLLMHACAKAERRCAGDAAVPGQRASTVIELYGRVRAALAASSGVRAAPDVIKLVMVGADVTMMASALLYGPEHLRSVGETPWIWTEEHGYESVHQHAAA
jgi:dihydroorotate dehydrogenase